ncbi:Protein translocase subunit SecE [Tepidimonas alkaliphilus]|uniref:Protein translocase subunit SecE n=1 Tax=Tepidimonas alkaliphilus TaxID=2588942 RepID=A0A554W920_9BURK|nr:preprotein translocase subunit SecE [Tepidimonas alkaliphilus]TSE20063.1 Protein translocase subunit SecE [Tepidimonas alkaliphilus]
MASTEIETVRPAADKAKLAGAVVLVALGFVAYYLLHAQAGWMRWAALLAALALGVAVGLTATPGQRLVAFARDAVKEVRKVVWPTRKEAAQVTGYVFAFVVVMAIFLWLTDKLLEWVLYGLILGWR